MCIQCSLLFVNRLYGRNDLVGVTNRTTGKGEADDGGEDTT